MVWLATTTPAWLLRMWWCLLRWPRSVACKIGSFQVHRHNNIRDFTTSTPATDDRVVGIALCTRGQWASPRHPAKGLWTNAWRVRWCQIISPWLSQLSLNSCTCQKAFWAREETPVCPESARGWDRLLYTHCIFSTTGDRSWSSDLL